jgi:hypothetical protein
MTTTHRGRPPAQERQPRGRCGTSRWRLLPCHRAATSDGALHAGLACLVAQPVKRGHARTPPGPGPRPAPLINATSAASPSSGPARPSIEPLQDAPAHRDSTRPCGDGCPPPRPGPRRRLRWTRWTRPDGPRRTAAGWTPDGWTPDGWTPDGVDAGRGGHRTGWTPDGLDTGCTGHHTAGHRTAGPPDPDDGTAERTPHGGRGPATDAMAGILAWPTTATTPDRWMPAGRSAGQPPSGRPTNQDSSAAGLPGRARPPPRQSAAGATPPSS